jgi:predicted component of type VI protein secretion system
LAASGYYALRFTAGRFKGGEFPLRPNREFTIGRGSEYDMVLDEDMVSRRHAKIATLHGQIVLQDLKSTNGTFVNGERIALVRLKPGDKVLIGTSIMEVVETDRSQPGGAAATTRAGQRRAARHRPAVAAAVAARPPRPPVGRHQPHRSGDARAQAGPPAGRRRGPPEAHRHPAAAGELRSQTISQPPGSLVPVPPPPEPPPRATSRRACPAAFPDDDVGLTDLVELFHINQAARACSSSREPTAPRRA